MNRALIWDFEANENDTISSYVAHVDALMGEIFAGRDFRVEFNFANVFRDILFREG